MKDAKNKAESVPASSERKQDWPEGSVSLDEYLAANPKLKAKTDETIAAFKAEAAPAKAGSISPMIHLGDCLAKAHKATDEWVKRENDKFAAQADAGTAQVASKTRCVMCDDEATTKALDGKPVCGDCAELSGTAQVAKRFKVETITGYAGGHGEQSPAVVTLKVSTTSNTVEQVREFVEIACNAHAELVEALREISQLLDCGNIEQSHWDDCLGIARAALANEAKAERGQA